jgi:hypothetical protein
MAWGYGFLKRIFDCEFKVRCGDCTAETAGDNVRLMIVTANGGLLTANRCIMK